VNVDVPTLLYIEELLEKHGLNRASIVVRAEIDAARAPGVAEVAALKQQQIDADFRDRVLAVVQAQPPPDPQ